MRNTIFVDAYEVAKRLEISKGFAYKIIKKLNQELSNKGFIIIAGRVSRKYFEERIYGITEELKGGSNGVIRK